MSNTNLRTTSTLSLCPSLETLFFEKLQFEGGTGDTCSAFIAMLKSLAKHSAKFRSIHFRDGSRRPVGEPPAVRSFSFISYDDDVFRVMKYHLQEQGVVVGNYDAVESLLLRGGL